MHGDFFLIQPQNAPAKKARRLPLGDTAEHNESWLRDLLFDHPDLLPIQEIEPSYGPLIPLCTELRTTAGPVDIVFINPAGKLTLVECKLWRNVEARRKVIAQVLDYAQAVQRWSYSDLQRQVSARTGKAGNIPYEVCRKLQPSLEEHLFTDSVSRALRQGRFLLLIAGDGIREDVRGISDLINRNATSGFHFAQVEVALYGLPEGDLVIQPRVISKTNVIERQFVLIEGGAAVEQAAAYVQPVDGESGKRSQTADAWRQWWQPVLEMSFDDPEQDKPVLGRNFVRARLPHPELWLGAHRPHGGAGVYLTGRPERLQQFIEEIEQDPTFMAELPAGAVVTTGSNGVPYVGAVHGTGATVPDDELRAWIRDALNQFANAARARLSRRSVRRD